MLMWDDNVNVNDVMMCKGWSCDVGCDTIDMLFFDDDIDVLSFDDDIDVLFFDDDIDMLFFDDDIDVLFYADIDVPFTKISKLSSPKNTAHPHQHQ